MEDSFSRTEMLLGAEAMDHLSRCRVAVFGVGGVGGHVCEALIRSGIGAFDLTDNDRVSLSNLNRQIIATHKTLGQLKTDVMRRRMLDINPKADIRVHECFVLPENIHLFPFEEYDYVVDAVDTIAAKLALIQYARKTNTPIISSMGAGNKLDPGRFRIAEIEETRVCPLARVMRRELKKRGIEKLKVVYSDEPPLHPGAAPDADDLSASLKNASSEKSARKAVPGSIAFVPSVAGLLIAGEVIRDLCRHLSPAVSDAD